MRWTSSSPLFTPSLQRRALDLHIHVCALNGQLELARVAGTEAEARGEIITARWHRRLFLFRVKALTAAQLLRLANSPVVLSDFGASAYVVFVL
jgi:hypothetical protein